MDIEVEFEEREAFLQPIQEFVKQNGEYNSHPKVKIGRSGMYGEKEKKQRHFANQTDDVPMKERKRERSRRLAGTERKNREWTHLENVVEPFLIHEHFIPALNGQKGLRAKCDIPSNVVLGRYQGVEYLQPEWYEVYALSRNEKIHDLYAFDCATTLAVGRDPISYLSLFFYFFFEDILFQGHKCPFFFFFHVTQIKLVQKPFK
ncbi:hypothetical protein RFI_24051 [Reticulomyxa filosa]|uniref:Uncharacterized protein n=1 Tax=Reticulomyxa filosa TaxID=46433 RepID=X6MHH4_RETFI|nr:hypothetical protein RFI_24051 [Reticulomyxa filosa]|eukprot:ETO13329.1 hypothetical protein RFI_24051 [Reticulomyxa filosa]